MRMAGTDGAKPARRLDSLDGLLIEESGRVPQEVSLARLDQERPLADRYRGSCADSEQAGFDLAYVAAVPGRGQVRGSRPALPR
jgi:hypothetical protein